MIRNLRGLATSNQRADGHETSVPGSKIRTEPKVTEQNISGVLQDSGSNLTELLFNARCVAILSPRCGGQRKRRHDRKNEFHSDLLYLWRTHRSFTSYPGCL